MASDVTQQIVGFIVVILLARKLAPEGYGQYNLIISIATIVAVVANFGMSTVVIREVSVNPKSTSYLIKKILVPIRSISLIIAVILFFVYNKYIATTEYDWPVLVLIIVLNLTLWDISESIAFGHEVTKFSSILNIFFSIVWLTIILIVPGKYFVVENILLIYCVLHFIKAISYVFLIVKFFCLPTMNEVLEYVMTRRSAMKMTLPYVWLIGISTMGNQLPIQFLNANANLQEVGFYSVGNKLMVPISIAVGTAFKAVFPFLTKLYKSNQEEFSNKIKTGFSLILTFGTILAAFLSLTSRFWLVLVFGDEYESSVAVFNFLVWFSIIAILDSLLSNGLSSSYNERTLAILATIDIIVVLPLIYLGSFHGSYGISGMKLISGIILLSYHWIVFIKILKVDIEAKDIIILMGLFLSSLAVITVLTNLLIQVIVLVGIFTIAILIKNSPVTSSFIIIKNIIKSNNTK